MKRLIVAAFAVLALAACNSKLGPEYTTAPVIESVNYSPKEAVLSTQTVAVEAHITSQYGLSTVFIAYMLDDDKANLKSTKPYNYTKNNTDVIFKDALPAQKAGTKVTFQLFAYTPYQVVAVSSVYEYKVVEETEQPVAAASNN